MKLFSFYPDAYGTLSTLKLQSVATTGSTTTAVKLAIWDSATRESLLETELATMTRSGGTDDPITFNTPFLLDPNRRYDMMLWIESMAASTFTLKSIVLPRHAGHLSGGQRLTERTHHSHWLHTRGNSAPRLD